jgi:hypothetical protein
MTFSDVHPTFLLSNGEIIVNDELAKKRKKEVVAHLRHGPNTTLEAVTKITKIFSRDRGLWSEIRNRDHKNVKRKCKSLDCEARLCAVNAWSLVTMAAVPYSSYLDQVSKILRKYYYCYHYYYLEQKHCR